MVLISISRALCIAVLYKTRSVYNTCMDELTIGDKIYISSKRAASITGYAKDYVGQLCREGHVEAKMVGRSWYVLESSIREHRFGRPEEKPELRQKESDVTEAFINATVESLPGTWESSKYMPEEAPKMPEIVPIAPIPTPEEPLDEHGSITEMQAAWKEWFATKQEPLLESPEVIETREEERQEERQEQEPEETREPLEEAVPVTVHRIPAAPVIERYEPQRPVEAPVRTPQAQPMPVMQARRARRGSRSSGTGANLIAIVLMLVFAGVVIIVGVIGSGYGGAYLQNNAIVDYLGGTSSISK
jgi:hypothetical protein